MIDEQISQAVSILQTGGTVIFPTDTVWGIGASIDRLDAVNRLYQIKKRATSQPTAVLVASLDIANKLGEINNQAQLLAEKFWPGALTIIVKAKPGLPAQILGKNNTIGLRQPNHLLLLSLLKKLDTGLVASSANFVGEKAPFTKEEIDQALIDQVNFVLIGKSGGQLASTVIDTTVKPFKIIRTGTVPLDKAGVTT